MNTSTLSSTELLSLLHKAVQATKQVIHDLAATTPETTKQFLVGLTNEQAYRLLNDAYHVGIDLCIYASFPINALKQKAEAHERLLESVAPLVDAVSARVEIPFTDDPANFEHIHRYLDYLARSECDRLVRDSLDLIKELCTAIKYDFKNVLYRGMSVYRETSSRTTAG